MHDVVGGGEVQAEAPRLEADQEHLAVPWPAAAAVQACHQAFEGAEQLGLEARQGLRRGVTWAE